LCSRWNLQLFVDLALDPAAPEEGPEAERRGEPPPPSPACLTYYRPNAARCPTRAGWHGIHFRSPPELRRELETLGIL
jgi:hypothetical protein